MCNEVFVKRIRFQFAIKKWYNFKNLVGSSSVRRCCHDKRNRERHYMMVMFIPMQITNLFRILYTS